MEPALAVVSMDEDARRISHYLSTGEKKRIAIATWLAIRPRLLVLDEPGAGLDPCALRPLIELPHTLAQTMLISTHDMRLPQPLCPHTAILDGNHVAAIAPPEQILNDEALLDTHSLERS